MIKTRFLSVIGGMLLFAATMNDVSAADACASSDGVWSGGAAQWNLYQSSNGNITGTMISEGSGGCGANHLWTVTGHHNNDGSFTYTGIYSGPFPRPETCAQTFTLTGQIFKPGCSRSTGSWVNNGGYTGTTDLATSCHIPQETVPEFKKWGDGGQSVYPFDGHSAAAAKWEQKLTPTGFNYGGRYVKEYFLNDGIDSCYFAGSAIPPLTHPTTRIDILNQLPSTYQDWVGLGEETVNYYRSKNISPCGAYLKQRMRVDCENGEFEYQVNNLEASQDIFTVSSKRGASERKTKNWGSPPPRFISNINVIINLLMED